HIPIHHRHQRYQRFAFGGIAYQFNALPFGLSLAPRVFTKCVEAAIAPFVLLPALVLARGRRSPTRHRCAGPPVASSTPICVSPDPAPPASAVQDSGRGQGIDIDSPPLAQSAVNMSVQEPCELSR